MHGRPILAALFYTLMHINAETLPDAVIKIHCQT